MKALLLFFIVLVIVFQWRQSRAAKVKQAAHKSAAPAGVVNMLQCAHCGVHFPAGDAVKGATAVYCSLAHRQARES